MPSRKKFCLIHANCQAEPLTELLALSPGFSQDWEVRHYTNYTREEIAGGDLARCDLFLYQQLGSEWGEFSSASLADRLGREAESFCIPNMFFKGYWPFWTSKSPIDFGDSLLDKLVDSGAQKPEILKIYYYGNLGKFADFAAVARESLKREEEKDRLGPFKMQPLLAEAWMSEALFYTCNHPGKRLLVKLADQILIHLGHEPLEEGLVAAYQPEYSNFELPIHPQVAEALGLSFIAEDHQFNIFGRKLTFLQYISRYIDCRQQGYEADFLGYLQLV